MSRRRSFRPPGSGWGDYLAAGRLTRNEVVSLLSFESPQRRHERLVAWYGSVGARCADRVLQLAAHFAGLKYTSTLRPRGRRDSRVR